MMDQHFKEDLTSKILNQACACFGINPLSLRELDGFENLVFDYKQNNQYYIFRLVHSDHKTFDEVLGEIEFIDFLMKNGAYVSTMIHSLNGNLVERIPINESYYFSVSVTTKGKGDRITEELRTPKYWEGLGQQVGLFHRVSKEFQPIHKRKSWHEDMLYTYADSALKEDPVLLRVFREIEQEILSYPRTKDNYGLIHSDIHEGNLVIDESGKFTIFDFDDASYKHFISDIAIILFYQFGFSYQSLAYRNEGAIKILIPFLKGYFQENHLGEEEWKHLPSFLRLREATLYIALKVAGPEFSEADWAKQYFSHYRDAIIKYEPFFDLDFLMKHLKPFYF